VRDQSKEVTKLKKQLKDKEKELLRVKTEAKQQAPKDTKPQQEDP